MIITADRTNDFPIITIPSLPTECAIIPLKLISTTDPELSIKVKNPLCRNINDNIIVNDRYND
jgi:hypothetical protein